MLVSTARAFSKKALANVPIAYNLGKKIYVTYKVRVDKRNFAKNHPGAAFINYDPMELERLRSLGSVSQYGQDAYLWNDIFKHKAKGFFIDIGGNHPTSNNNSYLLETKGWNGLAFDPLSRFEKDWIEHRKTKLHRIAIAEHNEERDFIEIVPKHGWEHQLSGFKEFVRPEDLAIYESKEYKVRTAPLTEFVTPGTEVDLLLIDVEGAEAMVLAGIDFQHVRPAYMLVENLSELGGSETLRHSIAEKGYRLIARIGLADDLFQRVY